MPHKSRQPEAQTEEGPKNGDLTVETSNLQNLVEAIWNARVAAKLSEISMKTQRQKLRELVPPDEIIPVGEFSLFVASPKARKSIPIKDLEKHFPDVDWAGIAEPPSETPNVQIRKAGKTPLDLARFLKGGTA